MTKKIIEKVMLNKVGNIIAVKMKGNKTPTPLARAYKMAKKNMIKDVIAVSPKKAKNHIRAKADNNLKNNLI